MRPEPDTGIGGGSDRFPETHWSAIAVLRTGDLSGRDVAFEILIRMYWKPAYKYLRIRWRKSNEDAKDLIQSFFARAIEKDFFRTYDPTRSRFRTYFRTCLDGFAANEEKADHALKRGGDQVSVPLDFVQAEAELKHSPPTPEECFEKEWLRSLFAVAVQTFRMECEQTGKQVHFQLFEKFDLERDSAADRKTYAELAAECDLSLTSVTNYLAFARREFKKVVLRRLREVTGSEEEFRQEARRWLGAEMK